MKTEPNKIFPVLFLLGSVGAVIIMARSVRASMGDAARAFAFAFSVALAIGAFWIFLSRFQKKNLSKFETLARIDREEGGGLLAGIGALFVAMSVSNWSFTLLEYLVICHDYGHAAWVHGLHVVGNKGVLSNGEVLPGWSSLFLYMGTFAAAAFFGIGSYLTFRYIGLRLQGRRLSDPIPKKKWKSSGKSDSAA